MDKDIGFLPDEDKVSAIPDFMDLFNELLDLGHHRAYLRDAIIKAAIEEAYHYSPKEYARFILQIDIFLKRYEVRLQEDIDRLGEDYHYLDEWPTHEGIYHGTDFSDLIRRLIEEGKEPNVVFYAALLMTLKANVRLGLIPCRDFIEVFKDIVHKHIEDMETAIRAQKGEHCDF